MHRSQKQALAFTAISRVADLAEFWSEMVGDDPELAGVDYTEAMQTIASWDNRLPMPT